MKDAREAISALLLDSTAVTSLVGNSVYPASLPQTVDPPAVVHLMASGVRKVLLDGSPDLRPVRIQIDSWGLDNDQAHEIADAVEESLSGYRGIVGVVEIRRIVADVQRELMEAKRDEYRVSQDFFVWVPK